MSTDTPAAAAAALPTSARAESAFGAAASSWNGNAFAHAMAIIDGLAGVVDSHLYVGQLGPNGFEPLYSGPGLEHLLGQRELPEGANVAGDFFRSRVHPHDLATFERLTSFDDARPGHAASGEYRLVGADRVTRWVHHCQRLRETAGDLFVDGSLREITVEREAIARSRSFDPTSPVEHRRLHDPLTGAANRELLLQTISETPGELTVLYVDIDHFKEINDRLGAVSGDEALQGVADRLRSVLRPTDVIARVGGDQFVAICRTVPGSNVYVIVQRLAASFFEPIVFGGRPRRIEVSIGLSQRDAAEQSTNPFEIVLRAEESMRADKQRKRPFTHFR